MILDWLWARWHVHDWLPEPDRHVGQRQPDGADVHYRFNRCWKCGAERGYIYTRTTEAT